DSVNLASRLEGQCKTYGLPIVVGARTAAAVKDRFAVIEIDFVAVKGKKEPEAVHAVLGREDMARSDAFQRRRALVAAVLARIRARDWDGAAVSIEEGRAADSDGRFALLHDLYAARIAAFRQAPPPEGWDGAVALETK